jgi:hypothetical protein
MREAIEARTRLRPLTLLPFDELSVATGGAIFRPGATHDEVWITAGYQPTSAGPTDIRIAQDELPVDQYIVYLNRTRARVQTQTAVPLVQARAVPLRERLIATKASLGLSTKELAEVLCCSRAAVYNWLDPDYPGQVNDEAMQRLAALERLAKSWNAYGVGALGAHLHGMALEGEDGRNLYSLLKAAPIDVERCEAALRAIADQCRTQIEASKRVDELVARGFGR